MSSAQKLELGTGWFETCAFLLVVILSLSSCFPNNMVPFFLFPLVILCLCFFCSFVFLFLTSIVIWTNGELGFKGLSWSGGLGVLKGGGSWDWWLKGQSWGLEVLTLFFSSCCSSYFPNHLVPCFLFPWFS